MTRGNGDHEGTRRVVYGDDRATFVAVCPKCGRFVKPDPTVLISEASGPARKPNATCKRHGRVEMPFEGYY